MTYPSQFGYYITNIAIPSNKIVSANYSPPFPTACPSQTIKAFIPEMIANNHGHVITIASGAGLFGVAGLLDYCASKFGAIGIHEALTSDLATMEVGGVHTTVVCPYFIDTGMFQGVRTRWDGWQ